MNFKESVYFKIYSEIWNLHKKYYGCDDSDGTWGQLIDDSQKVYEKYKDLTQGEFVKKLLVAILGELERCSGKEKDNGRYN